MYAASRRFWSLQTMSVYQMNWHVILIELLKISIPGVNSVVEISLYRVLNFIDKIREVKLGNSKEVDGKGGGVGGEIQTEESSPSIVEGPGLVKHARILRI